jgi:hypothetical protein
MDTRPHLLFKKLLQWLSVLTKRASSVVLRLLYALQAYLRRWSSSSKSRRTSADSSRCLLVEGDDSQVVNPSCDVPLLPMHTSDCQQTGSSPPPIGRSTYTTTWNDDPQAASHVSQSENAVNGVPAHGDLVVEVKPMSTDGVKRYERNIGL